MHKCVSDYCSSLRMTNKPNVRRKAKEITSTAKSKRGTFTIEQSLGLKPLKRSLSVDDKMVPKSKRARKQSSASNSPPIPYGDERSVAGHFGWTSVKLQEKLVYLPFIYRSEKQLCPVRMLKNALLQRLDIHFQIITDCIEELVTFRVQTGAECQLLNEINEMHCDRQFDAQPFTCDNLLVRLEDAEQLYEFINFAYNSLPDGQIPNVDKCGWIERSPKDAMAFTVVDGERYIPMIYFDEMEFDDCDYVEGWPVVYLKFALNLEGEHLLSPRDRRVYVIREDKLGQMGRVLNSPKER